MWYFYCFANSARVLWNSMAGPLPPRRPPTSAPGRSQTSSDPRCLVRIALKCDPREFRGTPGARRRRPCGARNDIIIIITTTNDRGGLSYSNDDGENNIVIAQYLLITPTRVSRGGDRLPRRWGRARAGGRPAAAAATRSRENGTEKKAGPRPPRAAPPSRCPKTRPAARAGPRPPRFFTVSTTHVACARTDVSPPAAVVAVVATRAHNRTVGAATRHLFEILLLSRVPFSGLSFCDFPFRSRRPDVGKIKKHLKISKNSACFSCFFFSSPDIRFGVRFGSIFNSNPSPNRRGFVFRFRFTFVFSPLFFRSRPPRTRISEYTHTHGYKTSPSNEVKETKKKNTTRFSVRHVRTGLEPGAR